MKKTIIFILLFLGFSLPCIADEIPASIYARYRQIVSCVSRNDAEKLSTYIAYPLRREYPLPDIKNPAVFKAWYPKIFDQPFRKKLSTFSNKIVFERNGAYGLVGGEFHGEIWLNEQGKIIAINYLSAEESKLKAALTVKIKNEMHPSVRDWTKNILVAQSLKLTIRIDETPKGFRYASWSKGRSMAEEPDLILYGGVAEPQGTMGGWSWSFTNGEWRYVVDDVRMAETDDQLGLFLRLYQNDTEKSTIRLKEVR
jgi:hypothetical protein